jgi:hypothetical protein
VRRQWQVYRLKMGQLNFEVIFPALALKFCR